MEGGSSNGKTRLKGCMGQFDTMVDENIGISTAGDYLLPD